MKNMGTINQNNEDALRIMQTLRLAAVYGLSIKEEVALAIHRDRKLLRNAAAAEIGEELSGLICGEHALPILLEYSDVISTIVPELKACIGFDQNNRYHQYTVYDHMMYAVSYCKSDDISVRLALFLHDIGKPLCYTEDENGGHFYDHAAPSHDIADVVLDRLMFDRKTKEEVLELILYHDSVIEPTLKTVRRWLNKIGEKRFRQLLFVREADILAHAEGTQGSRLDRCYALQSILEEVSREKQRFTVKDLRVNGNDILSINIPEGKRVGRMLQTLLDKVISGELKNEHDVLLKEAEKMKSLINDDYK